ncbi:hypothetical protein M5K25_020903 [Dendrobium thyrsiflorum]|uniref:Uncharacterized protein n=1 Tax=Dendrobium thyrsiflorum TaxID=117978 RepID=A0ABD0UB56_DENTH
MNRTQSRDSVRVGLVCPGSGAGKRAEGARMQAPGSSLLHASSEEERESEGDGSDPFGRVLLPKDDKYCLFAGWLVWAAGMALELLIYVLFLSPASSPAMAVPGIDHGFVYNAKDVENLPMQTNSSGDELFQFICGTFCLVNLWIASRTYLSFRYMRGNHSMCHFLSSILSLAMADLEVDYDFVYNAKGQVNILKSPFFDFTPDVDHSVKEYVDRIIFQHATTIDKQISTFQWTIITKVKKAPDGNSLPSVQSSTKISNLSHDGRHPMSMLGGAGEEWEDKARGRVVVKNRVLPSGVMGRVALVAGKGEEPCEQQSSKGSGPSYPVNLLLVKKVANSTEKVNEQWPGQGRLAFREAGGRSSHSHKPGNGGMNHILNTAMNSLK